MKFLRGGGGGSIHLLKTSFFLSVFLLLDHSCHQLGAAVPAVKIMTSIHLYKERVLNSLAVATVIFIYLVIPLVSMFVTLFTLFTPFFPLIFLYVFWIYIDRQSCINGQRRSDWWRSSWFFQRFPRYFPQEMIKTADLPPNENYILCMFPHGVFPTAGPSHFASPTGSFYKLFPGLDTTFHTLNLNFYLPVTREIVLRSGFVSVSQESLQYHLSKPSGHAVCIMPGGIAEALISQPGSYKVVLRNRKGFVKLALKTGANLVPVYSFGENELYDQIVITEGHSLYPLQQFVKKHLSVVLPLASGVGLFQNYFGLLPRRKPVYTVVGRPIKVPKLDRIEREDLDYWHKRFTEELVELFNCYKQKYVRNPEKVFLKIE